MTYELSSPSADCGIEATKSTSFPIPGTKVGFRFWLVSGLIDQPSGRLESSHVSVQSSVREPVDNIVMLTISLVPGLMRGMLFGISI